MEILEAEPIETTSTEIARVMSDGDPETMLAMLEKKAELAPRWNKAINTILVTQTFPEDWTEQGGKMCLSSAGAERVARLFPIQYTDQSCKKEEFNDSNGPGYRYIYEVKARMGEREAFAQGSYSTRDKFLSYKDGQWRAVEEINEGNIRNAAYHICIGNAIKALLGLRGLPAKRFKAIMDSIGEDATAAPSVQRANRGSSRQQSGGTAESYPLAGPDQEHAKLLFDESICDSIPEDQRDSFRESLPGTWQAICTSVGIKGSMTVPQFEKAFDKYKQTVTRAVEQRLKAASNS